MEKEIIEKLINKGFSIREISDQVNKSYSAVRYWLKKYNLQTVKVSHSKLKKCCNCKEVKEKNHFYIRSHNTLQPNCKVCHNKKTQERSVSKKIKAIRYKGGKCLDCSLSYPEEPYVIFDFHHLDPSEKKLSWNSMRFISENKMYEELDKCVLLCSNCHRKRHHFEASRI